MVSVEIRHQDPGTRALWRQLGELAAVLPDGWVLVGGLMVQLHALEHSVTSVRVTKDIDLLGQTRPPGKLQALDESLRKENFSLRGMDADGYGHRYERDGLIVDLLAPDGLGTPPKLPSGAKAIGIPGGSQALTRSEDVEVTVDDHRFLLRRPTLLGAVLIKARSLLVHSDPDSQREDLLRLLSLVPDPRATATEMKPAERGWLVRAQGRLRFGDPSQLDEVAFRSASLAYRLLIRDPRAESLSTK
jgi:hypothetical protein